MVFILLFVEVSLAYMKLIDTPMFSKTLNSNLNSISALKITLLVGSLIQYVRNPLPHKNKNSDFFLEHRRRICRQHGNIFPSSRFLPVQLLPQQFLGQEGDQNIDTEHEELQARQGCRIIDFGAD